MCDLKMASSLTDVVTVLEQIIDTGCSYCCVCLRTEIEKPLVEPKALKDYIATLNKKNIVFTKKTKVCLVCESKASAALRFLRATEIAVSVQEIYKLMLKERMYREQVKKQFNKTHNFVTLDQLELQLESWRASTEMVFTKVLIADNTGLDNSQNSCRKVFCRYFLAPGEKINKRLTVKEKEQKVVTDLIEELKSLGAVGPVGPTASLLPKEKDITKAAAVPIDDKPNPGRKRVADEETEADIKKLMLQEAEIQEMSTGLGKEPVAKSDRVDWDGTIPTDVISFADSGPREELVDDKPGLGVGMITDVRSISNEPNEMLSSTSSYISPLLDLGLSQYMQCDSDSMNENLTTDHVSGGSSAEVIDLTSTSRGREAARLETASWSRSALRRRDHVCNTCGKAYATTKSLGFHVQSHEVSRPCDSSQSTSTFSCETTLRDHSDLDHR